MILTDYSQLCLASVFAFAKQLETSTPEEGLNIIRHITLSSIKMYKKKYGKTYGDIVICADGRNYWRKEIFEYYKGQRKAARDASTMDWKFIFDSLSTILEEIRENFPYKVIKYDRAEADDVIAVLTKYLSEHNLHGLTDEPDAILIVSSDKDFKPLQLLGDHIKQWSPLQKKFISGGHKELTDWSIEHIVKGDPGDGVPNILSPDDTLMTPGSRQSPVTATRLREFFDKGADACRTDFERRNWSRNQTLVDFGFIPKDVEAEIINQWLAERPRKTKTDIMNYLIKHRCKLLLGEIQDF